MNSENEAAVAAILDTFGTTEPMSASIWERGKNVMENTLVPQVPAGFDRPPEVSDFKIYLDSVETKFKALESLLKNMVIEKRTCKQAAKKQFTVSVLILCGEHCEQNIWTTDVTVNSSLKMLSYLCHICNCESVTKLLVGNNNCEGHFGPALLALRPKLLKNTWKTFPAAVACYHWMLQRVKGPYLSEHLNNVLPTALILVDDFVLDNMILGIKCLHHVVENVTKTELGWHGQGEVIYKSLEPLMYRREAEVLPALFLCLAAFLEKVESGYIKDEACLDWSHHDDVLEILLQNMEMEQGLALRKAYIASLPTVLQTARLRACRWTNRILRVLKEYMEVSGHCHQHQDAWFALKALQEWMTNCWPVVHNHTKPLLQSLLRLVYDFSTEEQDATKEPSRDEILDLTENCLSLVVKLAPEEASTLCKDIETKVNFNNVITSVVKKVFVH